MDKETLVNKVAHGNFLGEIYLRNIYCIIIFLSDTNEIFTRLFDHRPFLNGEIQHFVRVFEVHTGIR